MKDDVTFDLERYRDYLLVLVQVNSGKSLQVHQDAHDIVQQTLLRARAARSTYRGTSDAELRGWLRSILTSVLCRIARDLGRKKRDPAREQRISQDVEASSYRLDAWLIADQTSPSNRAQTRETLDILASSLMKLPEHQRQALILHFCQGLTMAQIGEQLGCTRQSVLGLIRRASVGLRELMGEA